MLTKEYVLKVARLLDQTGEPRPGYDDENANLKGQSPYPYTDAKYRNSKTASKSKHLLKLKLEYEDDKITGDVRLVKR